MFVDILEVRVGLNTWGGEGKKRFENRFLFV